MRTVAIVGSQIRTRSLAPFDDPDIDIWVFNEAANADWCKRADAVFQMHIAAIYRSPNNRSDPEHWGWLQQPHAGLTVYMQDVDALVPCSVRYPLDEVAAALLQGFRQGVERLSRRYFTSTVAYALALAIFQEYERILIYGVEMGGDTEYQYQRPGVLFWVGLALGRGIEVEFVSGDEIWDVPLYGYDGIIEIKPDEFAERAEALRGLLNGMIDQRAGLEKRLAERPNGDLSRAIDSLIDVWDAIGDAEGRIAENERYQAKLTEMLASGGVGYIDRSEYELQEIMSRRTADGMSAHALKLSGAITYVMRAWERNHDPRALDQVLALSERLFQAARAAGRVRGIADENRMLMERLDKRIQAAGGAKAAEYIRGEQWLEQQL